METKNGFFNGIDYKELSERLNQLGSLGWEVVSTVSVTGTSGQTIDLLIALKREIQ